MNIKIYLKPIAGTKAAGAMTTRYHQCQDDQEVSSSFRIKGRKRNERMNG